MRIPYYCPYCDQRSTRRWNLDVHIKRKHGGSSGPYLASHPSHPFSHKPTNPYHNIEYAIVAENGWNSFQPAYGLRQVPLGTSQYPASPIYPPTPMIDGRGLSPETILKIEQLKRLVFKYRQYQNIDPDEIVRLAIYNSINGDNRLLDDKLEQLRTIDSLAKYYAS
jgi:hypothetical protein